jgi:type IV pilus assembly protein PilQ
MTMISSVFNKLLTAGVLMALVTVVLVGTVNAKPSPEMVTVMAVDVSDNQVILKTDSETVEFDQYTLGAPPRLVVDVKGALPAFSERSFTLSNGFMAVRVGLYAEKTRFVFDTDGSVLPQAKVIQQGHNLIVQWGNIETAAAHSQQPVPQVGVPVSVASIDFDSRDGLSVFKVSLSAEAKLIPAKLHGDIIRFGVENSVIPRSLRRVVDASVFPSSVLQITPYSTIVGGDRQVMFAARMKGPVEYSVKLVGSTLIFRAQDGPFAEIAADRLSSVTIPIETNITTELNSAVDIENQDQVAQVIESLSGMPSDDLTPDYGTTDDGVRSKIYTGTPVTLVFDDVDIRKVMQLIAEVSNQNLVLSDNVTGNISLRLHDVPWDQALDLVLQVKELGTIEQGNVIRVLPLEQIESMKTARLQAKKTIKTLEETKTTILEVNYKDIDDVKMALDSLVSEQGKITAVAGTKKLMVTDIPSKLLEIADFLRQIDEPVKQVMIEARLVELEETQGMSLGVKWGVTYVDQDVAETSELTSFTTGLGGAYVINPSDINSSSSLSGGLGTAIKFGILGISSDALDFRLSALEESGNGKIVSSPKIMALNGEKATISQGEEIPYQVTDEDGTVTIEFKDAKLTLDVTPQINPNGSVILKIDATNSSRGEQVPTGELAINTKEAHTSLMLNDGETTVIGGIIIGYDTSEISGVPFLMDIPYLGNLFKSKVSSGKNSEFLIFLTPRLVTL